MAKRKGLGGYENPQNYFRARVQGGLTGQKTLLEALKAAFTNSKTGYVNHNLINALAERQTPGFLESARQRELGTPQALEQALKDYYGNLETARGIITRGEVKPIRRIFKVKRKRGTGYLLKRMSIQAFAKANARVIAEGSRVAWATSRRELKLVTPKQAAAYRRQGKARLI